jgi:putative nucleotidyltransferase with HDIG domain
MPSPEWAQGLAERYLSQSLPRRWAHVQAVACRAAAAAPALGDDAELLVCAAWLHDIGYAPAVAETGFHSLDGARLVEKLSDDGRLAALVAHHSGAAVEASLRGLSGPLDAEFARERSAVADALWWADLTTGPDGESVTVTERLAEIERRYGPNHLVTTSISQAKAELLGAVRRTQKLVGQSAQVGLVLVR